MATAADAFCPRIADQLADPAGFGSDRREIEVLASDPIAMQLQLRARYVWHREKGAARACFTN